MLNYIKSECYRILHAKYLYFFATCALLLMGINMLFRATEAGHSDIDLGVSMYMVSQFLNFAGLLTICIADMVFSSEYKLHTMKNTLAYGHSRTQLYFGKFITQMIAAFVVAGIVFGVYLASGYLLLNVSPETAVHVHNFWIALLGCLPIWLGCLALANTCLFSVRSDVAAGLTMAGVLILPDTALRLLGMIESLTGICSAVREYLLWNQFNNLLSDWHLLGEPIAMENVVMPAAVGLAHMVVFLLAGLLLFKKKEM